MKPLYTTVSAVLLCLCLPAAPTRAQDKTVPEDTPTGMTIENVDVPPDTIVEEQAGSMAVRRGTESGLSVMLPAQYWEFRDRQDLVQSMEERQGCGGSPAVMEELVWGVRHKDAAAQMQCLESSYRFLLRDRTGLEDFVNQRLQFVMSQLGPDARVIEQGFVNEDDPTNPVVHRVAFQVPPQAPRSGGCGQQPQQAPQGPGYVVVLLDYFVRPEGEDLRRYEVRCYAPRDVYEALDKEIQLMLGSLQYTGELSGQFFAPDALADKLPGEDAVEETPGGGGKTGFLVAAFVIALIWMFMRRRKSQSEGSAS